MPNSQPFISFTFTSVITPLKSIYRVIHLSLTQQRTLRLISETICRLDQQVAWRLRGLAQTSEWVLISEREGD